jgi:autotransporter-associated beta strand protein
MINDLQKRTGTQFICFRRMASCFAAFAFLLCAIAPLQAQVFWTNAASAAWGSAVNWSPNGIPNATNAVVSITNSATVYTTNTTENGLGKFPYVFGSLNCNYGGSAAIGGTPGGAAAGAQLWAAVTSGTPVINVASGGYYFFYSVLYGTQGFNKTGPGSLTFRYNSNAQQFTGNVTISAGTLELQQDSSLGNSANIVTIANDAMLSARPSINNQTLTLGPTRSVILNAPGGAAQLGTYNSTFTNIVQGVVSESAAGSGLTIAGGGTVVLTGVNTYTGPTTVSGGLLEISGSGQLGGGAYAANITNNGTFNFDSSASQILSGVISGSGALTDSGTGPLTLSAAETYAGATTVSAGTLALAAGSSLAASSSVKIGAGATFDVSGVGASATYSLGSSASFTASSTATLVGGASGTINLGSRPITLNYDGFHPVLVVSQGTLNLSGQTLTVNSSLPLPNGTYKLIQVNGGRIIHTGSYPLMGSATNGATSGTIGFSTNAGVAYLQLTISGSTNPPSAIPPLLGISVSNNFLTVAWPPDHLGWLLWAQTNSLQTGLGSSWCANFNSVGGTNLNFAINKANAAVFYRLTYGDYGNYCLTNMLTNWDGHYELANTNVPPSNSQSGISDAYYTWKILRNTNSYTMIVDNEHSSQVTATNDPKSRSELYIPLHLFTNGVQNTVTYHINYVIPPLTDYGSNNSPFWAMQIYHASKKPMIFLGLAAPYQGTAGQPSLGVYTNMQTDGTTTGATQYNFKLINAPYTTLGDIRSTNGFILSVNVDFNTNAATSVTAQIVPVASPANIYQASCSIPLQSRVMPFTNHTEMYLKFGSYNAGGLHHHAKVAVSWFDVWSSAPLPSQPVLGTGNYYVPALQRQISAGNYDNLNIQ